MKKNQKIFSENNLFFVSVIVPAYNSEKTIGKCIDSLLAQNYPKNKYEIIIVDNNSSDLTVDIIKKYPVKIIYEKKYQSAYAARNAGIKVAQGSIIAFTDSDCAADKNWIRQGITAFSDKNVIGAGGKILSYDPKTWVELYEQRRASHDPAKKMTPHHFTEKCAAISGGNAFYKEKIFKELGFFDPDKTSGQDTRLSFAIQNKTKYQLVYIPQSVVYHKQAQTVNELREQNYRYGYYGFFIDMEFFPAKHNEIINGFKKNIFSGYHFKKTNFFKECLIIIRDFSLMVFTMSSKNKIKFADNYLDFIRKNAYRQGRLSAVKKYLRSLSG